MGDVINHHLGVCGECSVAEGSLPSLGFSTVARLFELEFSTRGYASDGKLALDVEEYHPILSPLEIEN